MAAGLFLSTWQINQRQGELLIIQQMGLTLYWVPEARNCKLFEFTLSLGGISEIFLEHMLIKNTSESEVPPTAGWRQLSRLPTCGTEPEMFLSTNGSLVRNLLLNRWSYFFGSGQRSTGGCFRSQKLGLR